MTPEREALAAAIQEFEKWTSWLDDADEKLALQEHELLTRFGEQRARLLASLQQARHQSISLSAAALARALGHSERPGPTVSECEQALEQWQSDLDRESHTLSLAKQEAARIRGRELRSARDKRDAALAQVMLSEMITKQLIAKYHTVRADIAKLYCALAALPMGVRPPDKSWNSEISLGELQAGDTSMADGIAAWAKLLEQDASATLPNGSSQAAKAA